MAGVPFEVIERLSTPETIAAARELLVRRKIGTLPRDPRPAASRDSGDVPPRRVSEKAARNSDSGELDSCFHRELEFARVALLAAAEEVLPKYLLFASAESHNLFKASPAADGEALRSRNNRAAGRERHLLMYLQRVATKNDTFSEFGPCSWGRVDTNSSGVHLSHNSRTVDREVFLERWTARVIADVLNADPAIRGELSPRVHPNGRVEGSTFIFTDTGETAPLDLQSLEILQCFNGRVPAHAGGFDYSLIEQLAQRKMLLWEVELLALDPHPFDILVGQIEQWRDVSVRKQWLDLLQPIGALPLKFAATSDLISRAAIIEEARRRLHDVGVAERSSQRSLYSAANPLGEDCFREFAFTIGGGMMDELARDAEPWLDLWRDSYAFVASRVAAGLRGLFQTAPINNGAVPLPAFLRHCAAQKLSLTGPGLVAFAHIAFQEVKAGFCAVLADRCTAPEWNLTAEDCHFVEQKFEYAKFDEYTYPSVDLQISATSVESVGKGDYEWILAELHPPIALLHHCIYWACPDKAMLSRELVSTTCGRPNFHYGFFAADFTAHTTVRIFDTLSELTNFVAPQRGNPKWRIIPPSEAEVYIDEQTRDVCLRKRGSHEYLGSFARNWIIPLGFHPFNFSLGSHTPRLRCGKVIVQRRSWTVTRDELGAGNFTGISRDLVIAVERLRAARDLPRYIYIRPTEQALRRSGAEGRDKDTKPVFIDLESYLFLEIFLRWLTKAGEIEVTEMLPDPDHLLWKEPDGRRTFELRTLIVPS